jgi:threonine-phosphate decarboxylase
MTDTLPFHGGQLRTLAERYGIPASQLLDFSANINPDGPPAGVLATLRASLDDPSILTSYPDIEQTELRQAAAQYAGVSAHNIVAANGFVPLLEAVLRVLPIQSCLLPVPAFLEYRKALSHARIEITPYLLTPESNFSYDIEAMVSGRHDAILLANPQNPSGVICNGEVMLSLIERAAEKNIYILLDEAFIDYLPEHSGVVYVGRFPNLIVFRSVTKFHGVPGLRVAYAVANREVTQSIDENLPPWPITTLASYAICAALKDEPYAKRTRVLNDRRKSQLQHGIEALGIPCYPSAANFLLLRLPADIDGIAFWQRMILDHHVVLRACANYEGFPAGHLRTAVRTESENARLVEALTQTLHSFRSGR